MIPKINGYNHLHSHGLAATNGLPACRGWICFPPMFMRFVAGLHPVKRVSSVPLSVSGVQGFAVSSGVGFDLSQQSRARFRGLTTSSLRLMVITICTHTDGRQPMASRHAVDGF